MTAEQIVEVVSQGWRTFTEKEGRCDPGTPRNYLYASGYKDCNRQMYLEATMADRLPPFDTETLARFRRGNDRERDLINIQLTRVGQYSDPPFTIENLQEEVILKDRKGRKAISGRKEGNIVFGNRGKKVVFELKTWDMNLTRNMYRFEDLFFNQWTRTGAYQLLAYMMAKNETDGIFILDRPALPRLLPVSLYDHMDRMEDFLTKAELVIDHIEAEIPPDYTTNPSLCKSCWLYGTLCSPPLDYGPGVQLITDAEFIEQVARYKELENKLTEDDWREYNSLDRKIKARLRGVESAIIGDYAMTGRWQKNTVYDYPDEVKKQYARQVAEGKFFVTLEKI